MKIGMPIVLLAVLLSLHFSYVAADERDDSLVQKL